MSSSDRRSASILTILLMLSFVLPPAAFGQSRPQRPEPSKSDGKRNQRPTPKTEEELKKEEEERKLKELEKNAEVDPVAAKVETDIVNVDAVVLNKKTGQIITGLKKENFAIFENGVKQDISNFTTPESPITVTLVLEYSRWAEYLGRAAGGRFEPGIFETVRPAASFLTRFIKPPNDYASVIAFDLRPAVITDFTNDPARIRGTIEILLRNQPVFSDSNLFDALDFALEGGKSESEYLDGATKSNVEYLGMTSVRSKRRAIILVASGLNTFSKINYGDIRKVIQKAGIPVYIISTGNLFYKKYEQYLPPTDSITGAPGRLSLLQAKNTLNTFAKESGGRHFEMTFESEIPGYLQSINALLRSQYSLAYDINAPREVGKKYKLDVKVDVNGDGIYDDKVYEVQHRPFVMGPSKDDEKKGKAD